MLIKRTRLIYLICILLILILLAYFIGEFCAISPAKQNKAKMIILSRFIENYILDAHTVPGDMKEITNYYENINAPEKAKEIKHYETDYWGNPVIFVKINSGDILLISLGKDAIAGGNCDSSDQIIEIISQQVQREK